MGHFFSSLNNGRSSLSSSTICELSVQSDGLLEAMSLRNEANEFHSKAARISEQSQDAYRSGLGLKAKELSERKFQLYRERDDKNRQAAQLFFKHFNENLEDDIIDLHRLYVEEALRYLKTKLDQCRSKNIFQLKVITGIGNNSPNRLSQIKPKVEHFAHEHNLKIISSDGGYLLIDLTKYHPQNQIDRTSRSHGMCFIQ